MLLLCKVYFAPDSQRPPHSGRSTAARQSLLRQGASPSPLERTRVLTSTWCLTAFTYAGVDSIVPQLPTGVPLARVVRPATETLHLPLARWPNSSRQSRWLSRHRFTCVCVLFTSNRVHVQMWMILDSLPVCLLGLLLYFSVLVVTHKRVHVQKHL